MQIERVEDMVVYQRAMELWEAINALRKRPEFLQDLRLRDQLADASDSVVSNIAEGFEQPTDRAFANYLYVSKASAAEVRTRLLLAFKRGYLTEGEHHLRCDLAEQVGRLATGWIKYLLRSDRRDRGINRRSEPTGRRS